MSEVKVGISHFREEDYEIILSISEDRDGMDETWEAWKKNKENVKKQIQKQGYEVADVLILPQELIMYCRNHQLPINGATRSRYAQEKVAKM